MECLSAITGIRKQPAPDQRGTDQSPLIVKITPAPKSEANAAEEAKEREEKAKLDTALVKFNGDLAFYTLILAIVAFLQFVALVAQALLLGGTLKATTVAANVAKDALITTERAFVFLDDIDTEYSTQPRGSSSEFRFLTLKPRWRNSGNTPTRNMRIRINWTPWAGDLADDFSYSYGALPVSMFLGPKATEWSTTINVPSNVATDAFNERSRIFIWGRVDYEDIFDNTEPHFTQWCYRLVFVFPGGAFGNPMRTQLVAFGNYNRSDEDTREKRKRT